MQWAMVCGGKCTADPNRREQEDGAGLLGLVFFPPLFFHLSECKSLSSLAEGSGLDPSQIFRSVAFPLLHPSAGLGLWLMHSAVVLGSCAVAATAGFISVALQGVWEVIKDLREEKPFPGS